MKIILRDNLEPLGHAGDVVAVKDGYARNYLVPRGLAYPATKGNLRAWEDEKQRLVVRISKETKEAEGIKVQLEQVSLVVSMQVGEEGRLFGSVTNRIVSDHLRDKGFDIDHRHIVIDDPIRSLGDFDVAVRLVHGVTATIRVTVVPETAPEAEAAEATPSTAAEPPPAQPSEAASEHASSEA